MGTTKRQEVNCTNIEDTIKKLRTKKELTQDASAKKADLPYTTLTKPEAIVTTKPTIQTVVKISKGLEVSIDDLLKNYAKTLL